MTSYHGWTHLPKEQGGTDPIPNLSAAATLPYPPVYPNVPITSMETEHRFWPGGWIVVPAYPYAVDGTVITGGNDSAYAEDGVRHDQSAADFASAAVTVSFTPEEIGLPTGDDAPYYGVHVGMRVNGAGTNIGVRLSPKPDDGHSSDAGYGHYVFLAGTVKSYFGVFRLVYSTASLSRGYRRQFQSGDTIEIKVYRTAGSGSVDLDNIYFYPVLAAAGGTDLAVQATHHLSVSLYSDLSATASVSGTGGAPAEPYSDLGGGGNGLQDTQVRRGWRDPDLDYLGGCGVSQGATAIGMAFGSVADHLAFHPRHVYASARVRGASDVFFGQTSDAAGFIAYAQDTLPKAQAALYSDHWGIVYLGLHPYMVTAEGEHHFAAWIAKDGFHPTGAPYCSTDEAAYEAVCVHDVLFSSSEYDWLSHETGEYAYR